jgi:NAD(P)-dependent dehydrogenase (short-subunit alcohol dehydrogenase family)
MTAQRAMSAGLPAPSAGRPAGRLADKVALVTGASRGIGRGIAEALAGAGARVVATSRSRSALDSVVDAITAAGGEAAALPCDVGDRDQVYGVVQDAAAAWGRLDILVNSAQGFGSAARPAASPVLHPLQDLDEEEWDYTYRTGPTATMWAMKASFEYLRRSGGTIINFASGQGLRGSEGSASYNCAKEAVRALSRTAAREWGRHGITVNVICPLVQTDATESYFAQRPGSEELVLAELPLRRMGKPKDVGELAVFLAGSGAEFITGMTILIDSGKNMSA